MNSKGKMVLIIKRYKIFRKIHELSRFYYRRMNRKQNNITKWKKKIIKDETMGFLSILLRIGELVNPNFSFPLWCQTI